MSSRSSARRKPLPPPLRATQNFVKSFTKSAVPSLGRTRDEANSAPGNAGSVPTRRAGGQGVADLVVAGRPEVAVALADRGEGLRRPEADHLVDDGGQVGAGLR